MAISSTVKPGPFFVGVEKPMKVYTMDNMLFTNAKVKDEVVYKIIDTLVRTKPTWWRSQPVCATSPRTGSTRSTTMPYHPGALKYFKDQTSRPRRYQ